MSRRRGRGGGPGWGSWVRGRSGAPRVVFRWTRNAFVTVAPPLGASPVERVGVKGGREWVPVYARVWAQNVVYATIRGNWWERSSQNVAWDVGENERGGCIKRSVGGA